MWLWFNSMKTTEALKLAEWILEIIIYTKFLIIHTRNGVDNPNSTEKMQFLVNTLFSTENYRLTYI